MRNLDRTIRDAVLRRHVEITTLEDGPDGFVLLVNNRNQPLAELPAYEVDRLLLLPESSVPTIRPRKTEFRVFDHLNNIYTWDGNPETWPVPEGGARDIQAMMSVRELGRFRGWRLGQFRLGLNRVVTLGGTREVRLHLVSAELEFVYGPVNPVTTFDWPADYTDPAGDSFVQKIVLNPAMPRGYTSPPEPPAFAEALAWVDLLRRGQTTGKLVRIRTYQPGLQRLPARALAAAGVEVLGVDPRAVRLFHEGRELPLLIESAHPQSFSPEDDLFFYAPPSESIERYAKTFWLVTHGANLRSTAPLRLQPPPVLADAVQVTPIAVAATHQQEYRRRLAYERAIAPEKGFSRWYWDSIGMSETKSFEFEWLPLGLGDGEATLSIEAAIPRKRTNSLMVVWLNGQRVGQQRFGRAENEIFEFKIPAGVLGQQRVNELSIVHDGDHPDRATDRLLIKGFRISSRVNLRAPRAGFEVTLAAPQTPVPQPAYLALSVESRHGLRVLNVDAPEAPELMPLVRDRQGQWMVMLGDGVPGRLAVFDRETAPVPAEIIVRPAPTVMQPGTGAGALIIYHALFAQGAAALAQMQEREGFTTRMVDVEEFYDAFHFGAVSHHAIHRGLQYAHAYWRTPRPFFVTLIGESSEYDGNPAELPPAAIRNFIPVFDIPETSLNILRGDARYANVSPGNRLPEVVMARLSVETPEQLDGQLTKIRRYTNQPVAGDWMLNHVFVSDDEHEFDEASRSIVANALHAATRTTRLDQKMFPYASYYRVPDAKHSPEATRRLIELFNEGAVMLNYIGHGGPNIWSHERLFHLEDLKLLNNAGREPFVTVSSCDNAWVDFPLAPVHASMGEQLARMPEGGAIAVFAPTAGAVTREHRVLLESLYDGVFRRGIERIGEATLHARLAYVLRTADYNLGDQFVLLGDPTTRLRLPRDPAPLQVTPSYLTAGEGGTVNIRATLNQPVWGWARISIKSDLTGEELATTRLRVRSGLLQGSIPIEADAEEATYNISVLVFNEARQFTRLLTGSFRVARPRLVWVNPAVHRALRLNGPLAELQLGLLVQNPSPIELTQAEVLVRRTDTDSLILQRRVSMAPGQRREVPLRFTAARGIHPLEVELRPGPDEQAWTRHPLTVVAYDPNQPPRPVLDVSRPVMAPDFLMLQPVTRVSIPIFNTGSAPVSYQASNIRAGIYDIDTGKLVSNELDVAIPAPGEMVVARLNPGITLSRFEQPLEVRLTSTEGLSIPGLVQHGPGDEPTILARERVRQPWRRGVDLAIDADSIRFVSTSYRDGETLFVRGTVRNLGDVPSGDFRIDLFKDEPFVQSKILHPWKSLRQNVEKSLEPGESRRVTLRWDAHVTRGTHTIFMVANSDRRILEENLTNNSAGATVRIHAHSDLRWDEETGLQLQPLVVRRNEAIRARAYVLNDGRFANDDVPIELTVVNPLGHPIHQATARSTVSLAAPERKPVELSLNVPDGATEARITVNPRRTHPDFDFSNNTLGVPIIQPVVAGQLRTMPRSPGSAPTYSLKPVFWRGHAADMMVRPDGALVPTLAVTRMSSFVRFSPSQAQMAVPPVGLRGLPPERDNLWTIEEGTLLSHPLENTEPLRLAVPAGTGRMGAHHVRVRTRTEPDYEGYPASRMRLRIEDSDEFKLFDFVPAERQSVLATMDLGVIDLVDGVLDIVVDDDDTQAWTIIHGFEFVPVEGGYTSPALDLADLKRIHGREASARARAFAELPQGCSVIFERRTATVRDGQAQWTDWTPMPEAIADFGEPFPLAGDLLQFRLTLTYVRGAQPAIVDVKVQIMPSETRPSGGL